MFHQIFILNNFLFYLNEEECKYSTNILVSVVDFWFIIKFQGIHLRAQFMKEIELLCKK